MKYQHSSLSMQCKFTNHVLCLPNRRGYQGLAQLDTIQASSTRIREERILNENCHLL